MSKRIPVYKICTTCKGTGEVTSNKYYVNTTLVDPYKTVMICETCEGTGRLDTGMFIEDPYSLFEN